MTYPSLSLFFALLAPTTIFAVSIDYELLKRDLSPATNLPGTWKYQGCYRDDVNYRTLYGASSKNNTMTGESCIAFCDALGYTWAGLEFGRECYCDYGVGFAGQGGPQATQECNLGCAGNPGQVCGGKQRLTMYANGKPIPVENFGYDYGPNRWISQGCYVDVPSKRVLANLVSTPQTSSSQTVNRCTNACAAKGYHFAGVEYGRECWCGHSLDNNPTRAYPDLVPGRCDMACTGNSSEFCGGKGRIIIYHWPTPPPSGWRDSGCWTDNRNRRTLGVTVPIPGGFQNMSIENCLSSCRASGYPLAGVEYGRECYCDSAIMNDGSPMAYYLPDRLHGESSCETPCTGNKEEICGGPDKLNLYSYTLPLTKPTGTAPATTAPPTPTNTYALGSSGYFNTFNPDTPSEDPFWDFEPATDAPPAHVQMGMMDPGRLLGDTGNRCVSLNDTDPTDSGRRGYCIGQNIILSKGNYLLYIYTGRIISSTYASTTESPEKLEWTYWPGNVQYGLGNPICGNPGTPCSFTNGRAGSSRSILQFSAPGDNNGMVHFKICAYFLDGAGKDTIMIDNVDLFGPDRYGDQNI